MPAPKYNPLYNVDDYSQWEGDWELWQGVAVAMTPSPFGPHQKLVTRLAQRLLNAIEATGCCECDVVVELDWTIDSHTVVRPDVSVVCHQDLERFITAPPRLIVEVLSSSTETKDRTAKFDLYQCQGVPYYLMIDSRTSEQELFQLDDMGRYQPLAVTDPVSLHLHKNCQIHVQLLASSF